MTRRRILDQNTFTRNRVGKYLLILAGFVALGGSGFFVVKAISDSSFGAPDVANGKRVYLANCLACHGDRGHGDGLASEAMTVKPDNIYEELTNPFGFKAELIDSVLSGDNGQGGNMPAFEALLSKGDVNDVFGYILQVNAENR